MSNEQRIWNFLLDAIGNQFGVAGLMGNLQAESGLNPINMENQYEKKLGMNDSQYTAAVDNGSYTNFVNDACGYGLAQWTYWSRKQNLYQYAKQLGTSIGDLQMQLEYLIRELRGYTTVWNTLLTAKSVKEASDVVLVQFERPADQSERAKQNRANIGQSFFNKYNTLNGDNEVLWSGKVCVNSVLNIRAGAGTNYPAIGGLVNGTIVGILEERSNWGRIDRGWICLDYVKRL